ncbi:MAG: signal recognition particle-docking protein FtsY [Treponema sp.]|nr:signal recognition particle-docking protein FtsY [Treponema sp.]
MSFAERLGAFFGLSGAVSDDFYDNLADLLVEGDFGAAGAVKLVDELRLLVKKEKLTDTRSIREQFTALLERELSALSGEGGSPERTLPSPALILLLGVNGVGKTTTAAKLAALFRSKGRRPLLAAADTFRAAAIDQIKIHGERLKIRVVAHRHGGDPAAVVYDAVEAALAGAGDLVIADTAGRMHTKTALVEELKKIGRVAKTKLPDTGEPGHSGPAPEALRSWLVLDATTGRNALAQAEIFHGALALDGVILTKYDSGAKGGAVFSLASELKLPVLFLCNGESYEDIRPFDASAFVKAFMGAP